MFEFQRYKRFSLKLILYLHGHERYLSLGLSQSAVFCCITHMTLSVDDHSRDEYRISNRATRLSQARVFFCDWSSKLVYGPENVKSTCSSEVQVQAFQDNLWTHIGHLSDCFQLLLLEVVIIQAKRWNCAQLLCLFCLPVRNTAPRTWFACPSMP